MKVELSKYTIRRRDEETECDWCGYALYVDDKAYMNTSNNVFCSKQCANEHYENIGKYKINRSYSNE